MPEPDPKGLARLTTLDQDSRKDETFTRFSAVGQQHIVFSVIGILPKILLCLTFLFVFTLIGTIAQQLKYC